jgi:hypothetical protein
MMTNPPDSSIILETTVGRVSAMTLIIPIRQDLVPPLQIEPGPDHLPVISIGDGPPVRAVENLLKSFEAVKQLVAARQPMGLNQVATIHFARWVVINEGQDLLFCANYDTSLDQYLTDFMVIANTPHGPYMDIVFGNCVGYPGSEPTGFINWARSWLVETNLFFPTISDVSVKDIDWLRKFRHFYTEFDRFAQEVPSCEWPAGLHEKYEDMKRRINAIDLSVVI